MNQLTQLQLPNISPVCRIKIEHDDTPESPREWENLGTMVCWHGKYTLGDEQPAEDPQEYLLTLAEKVKPGTAARWERWVEKYPRLYRLYRHGGTRFTKVVQSALDKHTIQMPLYLYDHSGITMRTSQFPCRWDSGQVGFIYVEIAKVKETYGWATLTAARREKIEQYLRHEVQTYDNFLTGEVYGYEVEQLDNATGEWEQVDSGYGFYGYEDAPKSMADNLSSEYGITLEVIEHAMRSIGEWTTTESGARR